MLGQASDSVIISLVTQVQNARKTHYHSITFARTFPYYFGTCISWNILKVVVATKPNPQFGVMIGSTDVLD